MITSFEKQRYLIDFTLSCLWRRKGKNISLWTVYTGVIFLLASVMFFTGAIRKEAVQTLDNAPEIIVQRLVAGRQNTIPLRWIEPIAAIPGVQSVTARQWGYYYDSQNGANYTVMVNDDLKDSAGEILIGAGVSRRRTGSGQGYPLRKNDRIPFKAYDGSSLMLTVKGIFPATSELISSDLILVSEKDFIKLFSFPAGEATDLMLTVKNSREMTTIATKITRIFPDSRPILKQEILRTYEAIFNWRAGLITVILSGSFLAFMILAWDKATGLRADEKREIGILKAIGWETSDILLMKFWEGTSLSLSAFLAGVLLAYLHIFVTDSMLFVPVLKGWSVLYPDFKLTPFISAYEMAVLFFLTVIPYTVATIVPSWRSATIDPDSVMRT